MSSEYKKEYDSLDSDCEFTIYQKQKVRDKLQKDVDEYLANGGIIEELPSCVTGRDDVIAKLKVKFGTYKKPTSIS